MAKKKPAEEHENLERWLVSYSDFMTLLFATFVVLYALAQSDVNSFKGIEEALRKAFSQNIFDNQANIMDGKDSILTGEQGATNPLMLEYMSQKYEQTSYEEIKEYYHEHGLPFEEMEWDYYYDLASFLDDYCKAFSLAGLERITGVSQTQLGHYLHGRRRPSARTVERIQRGVQDFASSLAAIHFIG